MTLLQRFIDAIKKIYNSKPKYRETGDGSDGTCDCIGMIIGALRRIGIKWVGTVKSAIHGSNYAARYEIENLRYISDPKQLKLGDAVLKAREPGHSKYKLPGRYKLGGSYYNGDLRDYYHIGVVTSINPFQITHMTSPTAKIDTKLNHNKNSVWNYGGTLTKLSGIDVGTVPSPTPIPVKPIQDAKYAIVTAASGSYVKMRQKPSTLCILWDNVAIGEKVTVLEHGEEWSKISYGRRIGWYMMTKFLKEEQ